MSVSKKLSDLFKENRVPYELLKHPETYTSQETARSGHVSGKKWRRWSWSKLTIRMS